MLVVVPVRNFGLRTDFYIGIFIVFFIFNLCDIAVEILNRRYCRYRRVVFHSSGDSFIVGMFAAVRVGNIVFRAVELNGEVKKRAAEAARKTHSFLEESFFYLFFISFLL